MRSMVEGALAPAPSGSLTLATSPARGGGTCYFKAR